MKLVLAGNLTLEPIARLIRDHEVSVAGFGDIMPILGGLRPEALAGCEVLAVLIDGYELAFENGLDPGKLAEAVEAYTDACAAFAATHPEILLLAGTLHLPIGAGAQGDVLNPNGAAALEGCVRSRLAEASRQHVNLFVLDFARLLAAFGSDQAAHDGMRYFARFGFSQAFARAAALEIERLIDAALHRSKKVLALDLDNTLWGGLVGEEGPLGIELSQDGKGRVFRHVQMLVRALSERGILLVGLSKNNAADVEEVFRLNPMMVLRRADFQLLLAEWRPKAETILDAAEALNLGLDAFVFIDDDPVERQAMQELRPEVTVPAFPAAAEALPRWLAESVLPRYFASYRLTEEDLGRNRQYRANTARATHPRMGSFSDYLASLDIKLGFRRNDPQNQLRLAQMTQKTNQFNLTTRRYNLAEIGRMIEDARFEVVAMTYEDRFGPEGVVGLAIFDAAASALDVFLLSCRVIGRSVEGALMREVERVAAERGCADIQATFKPTPKNEVAREFLPGQGFALAEDQGPDGASFRKRIARS